MVTFWSIVSAFNSCQGDSVSLEYSQINYYTIILTWFVSEVSYISFIFTWTIFFVTNFRLRVFSSLAGKTIVSRGWVGAGSGPVPGPFPASNWTHWPGSPFTPTTVNWNMIIIMLRIRQLKYIAIIKSLVITLPKYDNLFKYHWDFIYLFRRE